MSRLGDDAIIDRALAYRKLGDRTRQLEDERKGHKRAVIAELHQRRRTEFTHRGIKVIIADKPVYDVAAFTRRLGARLVARFTKLVVDSEALEKEREAGRVSEEDVKVCSSRSEPWIRVSGTEQTRKAA